MAHTIREVMAPDPVTLAPDTPASTAAMAMRDAGIGDVIVQDGDKICGIVTDRDIVVRLVAEDRSPREVRLADFCSRDLVTVSVDDPVDGAVTAMNDNALRRLPVVENGRAVGIVSLGDLAVDRDPNSALASISSAPANT